MISGYDPHVLYELAVELDAPEAQLDQLRHALPTRDDTTAPADPAAVFDRRPARIVFVGGNETQQQYQHQIEETLAETYGDRVAVTWIFPGWGANWLPYAEKAESHFDRADALVLMTFVRTNLGRRLRRTAGDAEVPWIACTAHGRDGITRAIGHAIEVAASRRRQRQQP